MQRIKLRAALNRLKKAASECRNKLQRDTLDNYLQLHGKPVPCRLREALFSLDGLVEHDTELDPRVLYTDTHGSTEVVMAAGHLLGFSLEPRIADLGDQTLYKIDREATYPESIRKCGVPATAGCN